jgi:NAD(P)-dependent dehydrogenase (short-subunit alcohol dehydrogenase family)
MPHVFITGANRGIGLEFVRHYAADGWTVTATARDPDSATELKAVAGDVTVHGLDVADRAAIRALADTTGPVDHLIANAGVMGLGNENFGSLDYGAWAKVLEINVLGAVATLEAFAPKLASGSKAAALSSLMGSIDDASSGMFAYRTSKAALNMAMKLIAAELEPKGIGVCALHPGWVQTSMGGPNAKITTEESVAGLRKVIEGLKPGDGQLFVSYAGESLPW